MLDHRQMTKHTYRGSREEAEKLIDWLMAQGYWCEVETISLSDGGPAIDVTCGCEPISIPFTYTSRNG